nr:sulfotransferase [Cesiribacter sp. SM1]
MKAPLFIGGCSRSGTTLLASMLGAAPGTFVIPESHFKVSLLQKLIPDDHGLFFSRDVISYISTHPRYRIWCCSEPLKLMQNRVSLSVIMDTLALHYAKQHGVATVDSWIDHTPGNIEHAPVLNLHFSEAKFIHIVRDGRGFAASVKKLDWGFHDLIMIGRLWRDTLIRDLNIEKALGDRVLRVHYEDLVERPEQTLQKICAFTHHAYTPEMLKANGFFTPSYTKNQHNLIGKGVESKRSAAWKKSLTPREIELFESVAGSMLRRMKYEPMFENPSQKLSVSEFFYFKIRNTFYRYYDKYKISKRYSKNIA